MFTVFQNLLHFLFGSIFALFGPDSIHSVMLTSFGAAPDVIVTGILVGPLTFLFVTPFARLARRRSEASRRAGVRRVVLASSAVENGLMIL